MLKSCIPGLDDAVELERQIRNEAFLSQSASICGIEIHQITPELLARLFCMRTPFMDSAVEMSDSETLRFLWSLSVDFTTNKEKRESFLKVALERIIDSGGFFKAEEEIDVFLRDTFLDAPSGGRESVPYTTSIAWMVYKMASQPFGWDRDRTMRTPIREIYQYIRCDALAKGQILRNSISDPLKEDWLASLPSARVNKPQEGLN